MHFILIGLISLKRLFAILPKITFARSNRADAEIQTEPEGPPHSNQDMAGQAEAGNPESKLRDHQLHGQNYDWKNVEWESEPVINCSCPKYEVKHNLDL